MIKGKYLQAYLNEFCCKLNRRYFGKRLFDRLVIVLPLLEISGAFVITQKIKILFLMEFHFDNLNKVILSSI